MRLPRSFIFIISLCALIGGWLFWNWPRRADMSAYVPADSLAFVEADDLSAVAEGIVNTEAWKAISGPADASLKLPNSRWVNFARWTGIGSTEGVVLARSQFAISWMSVSQNENGNAVQVKPIGAIVVETHTSQFRMRPIFEKRIDELVHHK